MVQLYSRVGSEPFHSRVSESNSWACRVVDLHFFIDGPFVHLEDLKHLLNESSKLNFIEGIEVTDGYVVMHCYAVCVQNKTVYCVHVCIN